MTDVNAILAERQGQHGNFALHANVTQHLKHTMKMGRNWEAGLVTYHREALEMIQHKVGRILEGDPNHVDHWADIAGYATLVANLLEEFHNATE